MYLPLDWTQGQKILVKLARNIYGLKQAGLLWYLLLKKVLTDFGFVLSIWDPCVFFKDVNSNKIIVAVHVDDEALVSNDPEQLLLVKEHLSKNFKKISDMGSLNHYIGIDLKHDSNENYLHLSQKDMIDTYTATVLKGGSVKAVLPASPTLNFDVKAENKLAPIWDKLGVVGYIAGHSRPDLACIYGILASYQREPATVHVEMTDHLLHHLRNTSDYKLSIGGKDSQIVLFGYCDSNHKRDGDSKSRCGQCWFLGKDSGTIYWKSQQAKTVSLSSTEAEIEALVEAVKDCIWLRGFLNELGFPQFNPTIIYQDNSSTIRLSDVESTPVRTRHIINKLNFIRQEIQAGTIKLIKVADKFMVADVLTKLVPKLKHDFCTDILLHGHKNKTVEELSRLK
jgi:histone deacetylase 1/2